MSGGRHRKSHNDFAVPSFPRTLRVNEVLRQIVAEELERLADADERLRLLTVTAVDTAPDLRSATVYLGSLDDEATEALSERRGQIQKSMAHQVRMKRTPILRFAPDPAVASGARIDEVLRRIAQPDTKRPSPLHER